MSAITSEGAAKHIAALLGVGVTAKKGQPADLKGPLVVGVVQDEQGELVCLMQFDLNAAGSVGAALSRIPAGAVQDSVRRGALDESLLGNFHEVANVLTVLTTAAIERRTILRGVKQGKEASDPDFVAFASKAKAKLVGQLAIQGYPAGNFGFLLS